MWHVYILECSDHSLYTGLTLDIERRLSEHNESPKGARYTRTRRPVRLAYCRRFRTRAAAAREESRIKRLKREEKLKLIESAAPELG